MHSQQRWSRRRRRRRRRRHCRLCRLCRLCFGRWTVGRRVAAGIKDADTSLIFEIEIYLLLLRMMFTWDCRVAMF